MLSDVPVHKFNLQSSFLLMVLINFCMHCMATLKTFTEIFYSIFSPPFDKLIMMIMTMTMVVVM